MNTNKKIPSPVVGIYQSISIVFSCSLTLWLIHAIGFKIRILRAIGTFTLTSIYGVVLFQNKPDLRGLKFGTFNIFQKLIFIYCLCVLSDISLLYLRDGQFVWVLLTLTIVLVLSSVMLWMFYLPETKFSGNLFFTSPSNMRPITELSMAFSILFTSSLLIFASTWFIHGKSYLNGFLAITLFSIVGFFGILPLRLEFWVKKYPFLLNPDAFFDLPEILPGLTPTLSILFISSLIGFLFWLNIVFLTHFGPPRNAVLSFGIEALSIGFIFKSFLVKARRKSNKRFDDVPRDKRSGKQK